MNITQADLSQIADRPSLFAFLSETLNWPLDPEDPYAYDEQIVAGRASARAQVSRLVPFTAGDPYAIFLVEFSTVFRRTDLREILRGIRQRIKSSGAYGGAALEDLVFVCATEGYSGIQFCHFQEQANLQPRLKSFGFERAAVAETYTLRSVNLPALALPRDIREEIDWQSCAGTWGAAWDIEKVTNAFFDQYEKTFKATQAVITGLPNDAKAKRLFTQRFFNRLLFLHFLSKRGWLTAPNGGTDYLRDLWSGRDTTKNFYANHLAPLFFAGLSISPDRNMGLDNLPLQSLIGSVPFLNGGLFEKADDEKSAGIVVPDSVFEGIFTELFGRYNFTITESSPDDAEVAVDPEMLGKVFEKLILKEDREAMGAFYTPRSVVQFMCRESLKGYLQKSLPSPEKPDAIVRLIDEEDDGAVTVGEARRLLLALERLRVVDPACGSGAFLLGMMQSIFTLMGQLDTRAAEAQERDNYDRKLAIIQKNLYGVDLNPMATSIAMLRLWLSLIVDYRESDIDRLPPLPNLDFKIEVGDSLSAPDPRVQGDIFRSRALDDADALADLKRKHFHATDQNKATLSAEILAKETQIAAELADSAAVALPADSFDWRVKFIEVFKPDEPISDLGGGLNLGVALAERGEPGGFHIVIANPPYGGTPVADAVRFAMFPKAEGSMSKDLYGIFMGRAIELLVPGGVGCYIVSNTWRTIKSFKPLRVRLARKTSISHVLDLPNWIFDATVNTGIVTFANTPPVSGHSLIAGDLTGIAKNDWHTLEANLRLIASHSPDIQTPAYARYTYPQSTIATYDNHSFFIASPKLYSLMSDPRFTRLGDIADVKKGLATADNKRFIRKNPGSHGSYRDADLSKVLTRQEMSQLNAQQKQNGFDPALFNGKYLVVYDRGQSSEASEGLLPNYSNNAQYYITWDIESVDAIKNLKGMRNPGYFFREGITFSWTGFYSPTFRRNIASVFDQSGSCIFCNSIRTELLLAFLNTIFQRYVLKAFIDNTVNSAIDTVSSSLIPVSSEISQDVYTALADLVESIIEKQKIDLRYPYHLHE